jgi:hypothetical protein
MKNSDIFYKAHKNSYRVIRHKDLDIKYQGTYELDFINFCISNGIEFENGPTIDYTLDSVNRKYYSDFYIPKYNLICEVKSWWTYNRDLSENEVKRKFSQRNGYNFIFVIDKDYEYILSLMNG